MEENRIKTRNALFAANILLFMLCFTFFILLYRGNIPNTVPTLVTPLTILFIEAVVFLVTFRYLTINTRKVLIKILVVYMIIAILITAAYFIYEWITGYVYIYKFSYGFLLLSFLYYPAILLAMLLLLNHAKESRKRFIVTFFSVFVVCFMFLHGVFGGLESMSIQRTGDTILVRDTFLLHGTEYEYKAVNKYFMEYVGISNEW